MPDTHDKPRWISFSRNSYDSFFVYYTTDLMNGELDMMEDQDFYKFLVTLVPDGMVIDPADMRSKVNSLEIVYYDLVANRWEGIVFDKSAMEFTKKQLHDYNIALQAEAKRKEEDAKNAFTLENVKNTVSSVINRGMRKYRTNKRKGI